MRFHWSGHKPPSHPKPVGIANRLLVTIWGSLLVFAGVFRMQHGAEYVLNWYREPVYAYGFIIAGVIIIPLAWIPTRWTDKAASWFARRSSGE